MRRRNTTDSYLVDGTSVRPEVRRPLTICCAHLSEGRPFVEYFGLAKSEHDVNLYLGDDICLVITGQGVSQCRKTLRRLFAAFPGHEQGIWLNFGIAGVGHMGGDTHKTSPVSGDLIWVDTVYYRAERWALPMQPSVALSGVMTVGGQLRTVDWPERDFIDPMLYDMECAAIVEFLLEHNRLACLASVKLACDGPAVSDRDARQLGLELLSKKWDRITYLGERLRRDSRSSRGHAKHWS